MKFAFVQNEAVILIEDLNNENEAAEKSKQYQAVINITDLDPQPQINWILKNNVLVDPTGLAVPTKHISKQKFLDRFTDNEICAIEDFSKGTSDYAKSVRANLKKQEQAEYIDLNYSRTINGVMGLVLLGLLTSDRANAILNTPLSEEEKFRG